MNLYIGDSAIFYAEPVERLKEKKNEDFFTARLLQLYVGRDVLDIFTIYLVSRSCKDSTENGDFSVFLMGCLNQK